MNVDTVICHADMIPFGSFGVRLNDLSTISGGPSQRYQLHQKKFCS
jgi:hypothetical protein